MPCNMRAVTVLSSVALCDLIYDKWNRNHSNQLTKHVHLVQVEDEFASNREFQLSETHFHE